MDPEKRKRLEAAGWRTSTVQEFLDLTDEDMLYIETKIALGNALRRLRTAQGLTQAQLARRIGSSQSRVARMETGDPSVTIDLVVQGLYALGADREALGEIIAAGPTG
ncbi:MAG: helix-turn-helix domain-containing protein [Candidatus Krumholzibacteriia bacterium]